LLLAANG